MKKYLMNLYCFYEEENDDCNIMIHNVLSCILRVKISNFSICKSIVTCCISEYCKIRSKN